MKDLGFISVLDLWQAFPWIRYLYGSLLGKNSVVYSPLIVLCNFVLCNFMSLYIMPVVHMQYVYRNTTFLFVHEWSDEWSKKWLYEV